MGATMSMAEVPEMRRYCQGDNQTVNNFVLQLVAGSLFSTHAWEGWGSGSKDSNPGDFGKAAYFPDGL
jgi:hypothetical protein